MAAGWRGRHSHRRVVTGTAILLALLTASSGLALPLASTSSTPEPWTIPPVLVGDQATYLLGDDFKETYTVLNDSRITRDTFGRLREAVLVDAIRDIGGVQTNATWAVDTRTGVFLYRDRGTHQPDGRTDWVRGFSHDSTFNLGGAQILAGRTLTPGEVLDVPEWTSRGTVVHTASVGSPEVVDGRELLPVVFDLVCCDPYTVWFERGTPWPAAIEGSTFEDPRVSHTRGDGPVAWSAVEDAWPPWEKNPYMEFRDPPSVGPLVEDDPGEHYNTPHRLREAIAFADENAEGLAAFREAHDEIVLMETVTRPIGFRASTGPFIEPAGVFAHNKTGEVFDLYYQALGTDEAWSIRVSVEQVYVLGVEVREDWSLDEEADQARFPIDEHRLLSDGTHVEYSSWASEAQLELGGWELGAYETEHRWGGTASLSYVYSPADCHGACRIAFVSVRSVTGSLAGVGQAPHALLDALDEKGPWQALAE